MKKLIYFISCLFAFALLSQSCSQTKKAAEVEMDKPEMPVKPEMVTPAVVKMPGIDLNNIDNTVRPADDFFRYVNGAWLDRTEIPSDRGRWGSFDELRKKSSDNVLAVLNDAIESNSYGVGTDQYKAAAFYQSAMDTEARNLNGLKPLEPLFQKIGKVQTTKEVQTYIERTIYYGARPFIDFAIFPDLRRSTHNTAYLTGGALGLPERDYYLKDDEDSKSIRTKYLAHIERMLGFLGTPAAKGATDAQSIMKLETELAKVMMPKEKRRNPLNLYNKRAISDVQKMVPSFNWADFLTNIGATGLDSIIVMDIGYYEALEGIIKNSTATDWRNYMLWTEYNGAAGLLSEELESANFDFYGKELRGTPEQRPRWERSLDMANGVIGEAIGKLYVDKHFPEEAKEKAAALIVNLRAAFDARINNLEWMTPETKKLALKKLNNITVKIGYPDKWKDYSTMDILSKEQGGNFVGNLLAASKWSFEESLSKLGKEVDKTEWGMSPQTVNAYYNPLNNEIVFPAAILQPPFYDYKADAAVNYGGIGAVIGHEISHGFDDQGSRFDADGNMTNWWTDDDRKSFEERNQVLIDQFDSYEALPGVFVNGQFTLGENIGDLGGINAAYDGLKMHWAAHGKPEPIDGFTAEQRFFISWGTIWRTKLRDEELQTRIKTDPHSPGNFRAIGPLSNLPAFYEAFKVTEKDAMYRPEEKRVKIW